MKFLLTKAAIVVFAVALPFLVALGHLFRFCLTHHENAFDVYPKHGQLMVNVVLSIASVRFRPFSNKICGINAYILLTISTAIGSAIASVSSLEFYLPRTLFVAIELVTSVLSLILLYLGWDKHERPNAEHDFTE